jgi:hypothetical protein
MHAILLAMMNFYGNEYELVHDLFNATEPVMYIFTPREARRGLQKKKKKKKKRKEKKRKGGEIQFVPIK